MVTNRAELLSEWDSDLRLICHGHYDAAVHLDRRNYAFGVPVIVLTVVVGTFTFASLGRDEDLLFSVIVGIGSLTAAVLAALQTFMKFPERAERHRKAGALFGSLLKELEQVTGSSPLNDADFREWGDRFRKRWDEISQESPTIPRRIWRQRYALHKQRLEQLQNAGHSTVPRAAS